MAKSLKYTHNGSKLTMSTKGEVVIGRGEVCMRGTSVVVSSKLKKNYNNNNKEQQRFDKYGYFHTGDIGQFTHDGCIQIIDRKKNKNLVVAVLKGGASTLMLWKPLSLLCPTRRLCVLLPTTTSMDLCQLLSLIKKHLDNGLLLLWIEQRQSLIMIIISNFFDTKKRMKNHTLFPSSTSP